MKCLYEISVFADDKLMTLFVKAPNTDKALAKIYKHVDSKKYDDVEYGDIRSSPYYVGVLDSNPRSKDFNYIE